MSNTAQRIPSRHSAGCDRNHEAALSAVLPGTISISWRPPTSTTEVHHCFVRQRPFRQNSVSSTPTASTWPIREVSACSSASPQRPTSRLTVCQSQPNSPATSSTDRPSFPTWTVTHRAALDVNSARSGPIPGSCSTNDPTPHPGCGHIQRRFRHRNRTGRPNAGRSTNTTVRYPSEHTRLPQPPQTGRGRRERITTTNGSSPPPSSTPTRSTLPRPTSSSHMRVGSASTGVLLPRMCFSTADYGGPLLTSGGFQPRKIPLLPTHFRRARLVRYNPLSRRATTPGLYPHRRGRHVSRTSDRAGSVCELSELTCHALPVLDLVTVPELLLLAKCPGLDAFSMSFCQISEPFGKLRRPWPKMYLVGSSRIELVDDFDAPTGDTRVFWHSDKRRHIARLTCYSPWFA